MEEKIRVSYLVIGAYFAFVVGSCLLVGLLPPLVNRPVCKDPIQIDIQPKIETDKSLALERHRRDLAELRPNINERLKSFTEKYPGKLEEALRRRPGAKADTNFKICSELLKPEAGVNYPWYSPRLPSNIVPVHYDLEILIPKFFENVYDGFDTITANVVTSTQYILLHAASELPFLQYVKDKNGNEVAIDCIGEFNYFKNDYYIIKTVKPLQPSDGPIAINFLFLNTYLDYDTGIFELKFGKPGSESVMVATKFEPVDARKAYPCFDEPGFKATYQLKIIHPNDTIALSNTPPKHDDPIPTILGSVETTFEKTPPMPTYLIAFVVFYEKDFKKETLYASGDLKINVWARTELLDEGYVNDTAIMTLDIYTALLDIFRDVNESAIPPKIDLFAIPEYPIEAVPHFGLPIFRENEVLFKKSSASERDLQRIALLIAKQLSEFWFGNFASFAWWNELWLQEALGDYVKYRAVEEAYPNWNILSQFITEELIYALVDDGYPSSHPVFKNLSSPYEIEEYFDDVESTKAAAIFRMAEEEKSWSEMESALTAYLNAHPWGIADIEVFYYKLGQIKGWYSRDFFDRWTRQANYPLLNIELVDGKNPNEQMIKVIQSRALNSQGSIFAGDLLYPSPYDWVWYVPLSCSFGTSATNDGYTREQDFAIDKKEFTAVLRNENPTKEKYKWVHCDRKFTGFYETDYTAENWELLGQAMKNKNNEFTPEDRANIVHNLFVNGFTERTSYKTVVDVLDYLLVEDHYLPWKTVNKHVTDMVSVLDYKKSFLEVSSFFSAMMRKIENTIDLWNPSGTHIEELLKETIISLACRLQDSYCLKKTSELWSAVKPNLINGNYNQTILPPYIREVVFNYHIQNTYNVDEWDLILMEYENINDLRERARLLESLTFSRLPWLLTRILKVQKEDGLERVDFFKTIQLLSENPLGREIVWDYIRINFKDISDEYGEDDPRLGRMLLDVVKTFENEFLFYELLEFVFFTSTGATANARFRALEIVSTNFIWLTDKEEEIMEAFGGGRKRSFKKDDLFSQQSSSFVQKAKQEFKKRLSESQQDHGVFKDLKNLLL